MKVDAHERVADRLEAPVGILQQQRRQAYIVDVDGTLLDVSGARKHLVEDPEKYWEQFTLATEACPAIQSTIDIIVDCNMRDVDVVIVTARAQRWEELTRRTIAKHLDPIGAHYEAMHLRADTDLRPDEDGKRDVLALIRETHDVVGATDDKPSVIALWHSEGIPVVVAPGWDHQYETLPAAPCAAAAA